MTTPNNTYVKRTQRDYTLGFKLQVVAAVERGDMTYKQAQDTYGIQGRSTVLTWLRKHGKMDWTQSPRKNVMHQSAKSKESPAQKIKRLEKELEDEKIRTLFFNRVIDILDAEHGTNLRKKYIDKGARSLQEQERVSLARVCKLLGISRQSVYQRERRAEQRQMVLKPVKQMILDIRRYMPRLGTRKLYYLLKPKLRKLGIKLGRDALFNYLRDEQLLVRPKRSFIKTTNSRHWMKKHPNLLKEYEPRNPEEVLVSDITYLQSEEGVHYLSLVTDAYSRKIMGYELSNEMKATDVVQALDMAIKNRQYHCSSIHHSDRGLQYCSSVYQEKLKAGDLKSSMTDGYDCYQNALAERVNGILKQEFLLNRCKGLDELKYLVKESITIYNSMRPHLSLGMKTPNEVHEKSQQRQLLA
ncbi:IS3 family transposase [Vibrio mediterranei]